jgi:hypothetical protein
VAKVEKAVLSTTAKAKERQRKKDGGGEGGQGGWVAGLGSAAAVVVGHEQ